MNGIRNALKSRGEARDRLASTARLADTGSQVHRLVVERCSRWFSCRHANFESLQLTHLAGASDRILQA